MMISKIALPLLLIVIIFGYIIFEHEERVKKVEIILNEFPKEKDIVVEDYVEIENNHSSTTEDVIIDISDDSEKMEIGDIETATSTDSDI